MTDNNGRSFQTAARGTVSAFALLVSAALLVAPAAEAQVNNPPAAAIQLPGAFADEVEIRIAELHNALRITPDQEGLFRAYADTMRANAQSVHAMFVARAQTTDFSAPARLRWFAQATAARADAINKLIAPFDTLYQALSPGQKVAADQYFEQFQLRRMPMRMHMHMQQ